MLQKLIDAVNRLKAAADGDKPKHAQFAAGAMAGGLAGAMNNPPNHDWDYVDGLTPSEMDDWGDLVLEAIPA